MSISNNCTEICDQLHQMYAEGTSDIILEEYEIIQYLLNKKYAASNIDIWHDDFKSIWRWYADIDIID